MKEKRVGGVGVGVFFETSFETCWCFRCCRFLLFVLRVRCLEWKGVLERCFRWCLEVCTKMSTATLYALERIDLFSSTTISGMNHNRQATRKIAWLWHERTDTLFTRPLGPRAHPHRLTKMREDTSPPRHQTLPVPVPVPAAARETVPDPSLSRLAQSNNLSSNVCRSRIARRPQARAGRGERDFAFHFRPCPPQSVQINAHYRQPRLEITLDISSEPQKEQPCFQVPILSPKPPPKRASRTNSV